MLVIETKPGCMSKAGGGVKFGRHRQEGTSRMSKVISVVVPHKLGTQWAKQRIEDGIPQFQPTFGRAATLERTNWDENTLNFTISTMGIRTSGTIVVTEETATVQANVPVALVPLAGTAEQLIQKHGAELLAGSPPVARRSRRGADESGADEIRRRARQAAQAKGQDWAQLSKEERKSFRQQARRELRMGSA
jgi:hypothetical protein